jgi:P27 family predicted phage terminase small subunit
MKIDIKKMGLCKEASDFIKKVIELNDNVGDLDVAAITMLANNYDTYIQASKQVKQEGCIYINNQGNPHPNPAVKIANEAQKLCMAILTEYGLTLKSRSKLKSIDDVDDSPLKDLLG